MKKKSKKDSKASPEDILKRIKHKQYTRDRLQLWQSNPGVLWFACGNGRDTVFVNSRKKLFHADKPFKTKLTHNIVQYFREDKAIIPGRHVYEKVEHILRAYIYFDDSRSYDLVSI